MRKARLTLLAALFAIPLIASATLAAETRAETVNQALASLLLGTLPLFAAMLFWVDELSESEADVRYGANRRACGARSLGKVALLVSSFAACGSLAAILYYRGVRDPLLTSDLAATLPIAIAGGLSLTGFLGLGRVWLGRWGLVAALVLVWILGPLELPIAAAVPTGHMRHLLGIGADLPLPPWASFIILYAMTALTSGGVLLRVPK